MRCGGYSLVGVDGREAGVYPLRCKRWSCPSCGVRKTRQTMGRIAAGMKLGRPRFFSLTAPGDEDAVTSWRAFPRRWKLFHQRVRRRYPGFEYVGVVEPQQRGHPHIHVLYRGGYIPRRILRGMARASGFGKVADIRDAHGATPSYLVKYLTKDLRPPAEPGKASRQPAPGVPRHFRRVRMSKGWCERKEWPASRWSEWWILDGPPAHAALNARRLGYRVVELVLGRLQLPFLAAAQLRWLRSLADRAWRRPRRAA